MKPKNGRMEEHDTSNRKTYLEINRSKVKINRPINASETMRNVKLARIPVTQG